MGKYTTKAFKVELEAWDNFVKAATRYEATPGELLRQLVRHVDVAVKAIQDGKVRSFNGDVARLIATEFP